MKTGVVGEGLERKKTLQENAQNKNWHIRRMLTGQPLSASCLNYSPNTVPVCVMKKEHQDKAVLG